MTLSVRLQAALTYCNKIITGIAARLIGRVRPKEKCFEDFLALLAPHGSSIEFLICNLQTGDFKAKKAPSSPPISSRISTTVS